MRFVLALAAATVLASAVAAAPQQAPTVVTFAADSDALNADARARLDGAVEQFRRDASQQVIIAGHAGSDEGSSEYTVGLSHRRANNARDYLVSRGVPASVTTTQAFGQSRPALKAAGPAAHRRVEVTIGGDSGW